MQHANGAEQSEAVGFTFEQVRAASLEYFGGDDLAADAFARKYALRSGPGENEYLELTPAAMHLRLAREFARIESKYSNPMSVNEIFTLLADVRADDAETADASFDASQLGIEELVKRDVGYGFVIPQGSPMSGIGDQHRWQSLSNCFVIDPPWDSYGGIFRTDEEGAQIMKRRGGVGHDVSSLRWKGAATKNAAGTSDGVALFCERFSRTTREVAQGGRRGARMLTADVRHPDILDFIKMKQDLQRVTGANVSTRLSDEFMTAARDNGTYDQLFPCDEQAWESAPAHVKIRRNVQAAPVWDEITTAAWSRAEPGVLFWDRVLNRTPADAYADLGFRTISTNPCGELPLCAYDSCRLMVINLYKFVLNRFTGAAQFAWEAFKRVVRKAQRLMDDLVDLEIEAVDRIITKIENDNEPADVKSVELNLWRKIREKAARGRRTGLGITGLGDCLAALGVRYGSQDSIRWTEDIYRALAVESYRSSCIMARERGAFPIYDWEREREHAFLKQVREADSELDELWRAHGRRNIANTTTAPAGTTSTQTRTTSGIENVWELVLIRRRKLSDAEIKLLEASGKKPDFIDASGDRWQEYKVEHPAFSDWRAATGLSEPAESPWYGATVSDVDWVASVELQGAAQKWVCHAISKTCNLPSSASVDVVKAVYIKAWEVGCKGITVYRDGCRDGVLISASSSASQDDLARTPHDAPKRPKVLPCEVHHAQVTVTRTDDEAVGPSSSAEPKLRRVTERFLVLVGLLDGKPYEVFGGAASAVEVPRRYKRGTLVKSKRVKGVATYDLRIDGGDDGDDPLVFKNVVELFDDPDGGTVTRIASLALRHGVPVQHVVEQLHKDRHSGMSSLGRVVARILKGHIPDGTSTTVEKTCTECGGTRFAYQEGCPKCLSCGHSKCG